MGTSLVVQWLRLCASNVGDTCFISGWGTKTPYASWHVARKKNYMQYITFSSFSFVLEILLQLVKLANGILLQELLPLS